MDDLDSILKNLKSRDKAVRASAEATLGRNGSLYIETLLQKSAAYKRRRKLCLVAVWPVIAIFLIVGQWSVLHSNTYSLPLFAAVPCVFVWLTLYGIGMLLIFGSLSRGYRLTLEALSHVRSSDVRVIRCLIDGIGYDLPQTRWQIIYALGRVLPERSDQEIAELISQFIPNKSKNLWVGVINAACNPQIDNEQAEDTARLIRLLVHFEKPKCAASWLKQLAKMPNLKVHTRNHRYVQDTARQLLASQ